MVPVTARYIWSRRNGFIPLPLPPPRPRVMMLEAVRVADEYGVEA